MIAKLELSRLRQIGWDEWDPIGIRSIDDHSWRGPAADEYDQYLLHAARLLLGGAGKERAIEYLDMIASEHMGLGKKTEAGRIAAVRTVDAIAAYLGSLSDAVRSKLARIRQGQGQSRESS
jgi:hypothetical protein